MNQEQICRMAKELTFHTISINQKEAAENLVRDPDNPAYRAQQHFHSTLFMTKMAIEIMGYERVLSDLQQLGALSRFLPTVN